MVPPNRRIALEKRREEEGEARGTTMDRNRERQGNSNIFVAGTKYLLHVHERRCRVPQLSSLVDSGALVRSLRVVHWSRCNPPIEVEATTRACFSDKLTDCVYDLLALC
jgi:hypothetical protein